MSEDTDVKRVAAQMWTRYKEAQQAKSAWTAEERQAKTELLAALGYDPDDEKPQPAEVYGLDGTHLGNVGVSDRKGLDLKYLRDRHPNIYAECEKWTHPISVRQVK